MKGKTYWFQCLNGHVGSIASGSELEKRAQAREAEGYLDAIILHYDECPDCLSEANERALRTSFL